MTCRHFCVDNFEIFPQHFASASVKGEKATLTTTGAKEKSKKKNPFPL